MNLTDPISLEPKPAAIKSAGAKPWWATVPQTGFTAACQALFQAQKPASTYSTAKDVKKVRSARELDLL